MNINYLDNVRFDAGKDGKCFVTFQRRKGYRITEMANESAQALQIRLDALRFSGYLHFGSQGVTYYRQVKQ